MYVNNGFWDTYRTAWPWFALMLPGQEGRMLQGFLNQYRDDGLVPQWSAPWDHRAMLGTASDVVFADAFAKGVRGFDSAQAYEAMLKNAMGSFQFGGRNGNKRSRFLGYVPQDLVGGSAAWHLEDCIADFGISQMADAMGKPEEAAYFRSKSLDYAKIFSPSVGGFFRGRKLDGSWRTADADFHANEWGNEFVEGGPWQYRTLAPHDGQGLANLFGGRASLEKAIDEIFDAPPDWRVGSYGTDIHEMKEARDSKTGQYGHTNEETFSMIYMYDYAGAPAKAQLRARDVMDRIYTTGIGDGKGYLGDEDNGAMSSWYLFSALGFFPCAPGRAEYAIGSPLFTKATIHLENGKTFVVNAPGNSAANMYIQSATLNGMVHTQSFLRHADIAAGGTLALNMGANPSIWGTGANDVPTSISREGAMPAGLVDLAQGGAAIASSEYGADSVGQAFDDNSDTKWRSQAGAMWIQYRLPAKGTVGMYTLTSGGDAPEADPKEWTLSGSDNGTDWTALDTRKNESFRLRNYTRPFRVESPQPFSYYRLEIKAANGAAFAQLGEVELLRHDDLMDPLAIGKALPAASAPSIRRRIVNGWAAIPAEWIRNGTAINVRTLKGRRVATIRNPGSVVDLQRDCRLPAGLYILEAPDPK
jgi:hypothetical protein